jgi:Ser/Thr protein kinase RdoA (MazF antagonist)
MHPDNTLEAGLALFAALPGWLVAVVQPETAREAMAGAIPELASGRRVLLQCEIGRVRMKKGRWTGIYSLTTATPDGAEQRVQLQGTLFPPGQPAPESDAPEQELGGEGWRCYVPALRLLLEPHSEEAELPALVTLTDPGRAAPLLELSIREAAPQYRELRVERCAPRVVRAKPGSRYTILYEMVYSGGDGPNPVVAKVYKGGKGRNPDTGMRALWDSTMGASAAVRIAEPLGYLPEFDTALQGPVREERLLKDLVRSALRAGTAEALAELAEMMRKTAAGLAALHRSGVTYGEAECWDDASGEAHETMEQLGAVFPELQAAAAPLLERIETLAAATPADPLAPAHGSFRPAQVLMAGQELAFIDFDSFCQAEPAMDLALFLSSTKNVGLSEPHEEESGEDDSALDPATRDALLEQLDGICEAFLAEYERHAPVSRQRVALWETLDLFDLVLTCWTKIKPVRVQNTLAMLERHLRPRSA